ncbi:alpha/beta hydrolase family protein [Streptomyces sp. NPDC048171]|uniref:alpha/beta hydrolase family protein n=1 Tax=unclassified Streptomyces TaxID=2593676 RepID=UPI00136D945F|nr:alpha/beta hydrolase [Streptomyces sp. SID5789]MZE74182.1 alpha/beta fold hydrolase [Streptomyces sp. SID5789]
MEGVDVRDVEFRNGPVGLAGSLSVPRRTPARAGVVLVGGSGPTDRHNGTFFAPLRRHLLNAGIAVLSYDKRGVGGSSGDWRAATLSDLAADARAALDFLRSQPGVRSETAGLFGHSEGGWVVLRAAAARDDLPWVVTNSCPGTSPAVQERHALANHLHETRPHSQNDVERTLDLYDRLIEAGRRDADFATAMRLVDHAGRPPGLEFYWGDVDDSLWTFLKRKQDHEPTGDLLRLRCPHLALFGGADPLIPVAESLRVLGTTVAHPSRHRRATLTVEVLPGADHRMRLPEGDEPPPEYFTKLTGWLRRR